MINLAVLNPAGWVAMQEKSIMITTFLLIMLVVVPVIIMVFVFSYKYRASNVKAKYLPNWSHNTLLELIWWGIPSIIILILAIMTWSTTHKLDPYRKLEHPAKPLEIQVVALDWKWLFIFPEQNIASLNYLVVPVNRPLNFTITADAPMNSFMIPQLGGQIYAMQGMKTKIHLIAEKTGTFDGYSSNYSGYGFSGMRFKLDSKNEQEFEDWVAIVKNKNNYALNKDLYNTHLLPPSRKNPAEYYSSVDGELFENIVNKYMMGHSMESHHDMQENKNHEMHSSDEHSGHEEHNLKSQEINYDDVKHVAQYYKKTGNSHH